MSNYKSYVDNIELRVAEIATEIGDYECAVKIYRKAINRLSKYNGNNLYELHLVHTFLNKIDQLEDKLAASKAILKYDTWRLSKSAFVKGIQCHKYLYLDKFKKFEQTPISIEKQALFDKGRNFEADFRKLAFPDGINIKDKVAHYAYFNSYTQYLIDILPQAILYEATIIEDEVMVMCDVLVKKEDGMIDIYEVKLNKEPNEAIYYDIFLQYYVCEKRFGDRLRSFNLILSNGDDDGWKIDDCTENAKDMTAITADLVNELKKVIESSEPEKKMGRQCREPYECSFIDYCCRLYEIDNPIF
jgi:hypothetical protein